MKVLGRTVVVDLRGGNEHWVGSMGMDIVVWGWGGDGVGACTWGGGNTGARVKRKGLTLTAAKGDCVHRSLYLKISIWFQPQTAKSTVLK